LPGKVPEAVRICRNKYFQREALRSAGFHTPAFRRVTTIQEVCDALHAIGLPAVLKPTFGSGSVGVKLCVTETDAITQANCLLERTANERGIYSVPEILVEEYLRGDEFSVETLGDLAIGITRKYLSPEPFFVETGHDFPATLLPGIRDSIIRTVQNALRSLDMTWGPAHTELRWTSTGPVIIEINPRLAGGFIPEIVRLATGVNMIRETLRLVVGQAADVTPLHNKFASIRFLVPPRKGSIKSFAGFGDARQIAGVTDIQLYRKAGEAVELENDFRDRIGHVISCANSQALAAGSIQAAMGKISMDIEDR
jgi:argininosuccinate lyase